MQKWITTRTLFGSMVFLGSVLLFLMTPNPEAAWRIVHEHLDHWQEWVQANLLLAVVLYITVYVVLLSPPVPLATVTALVSGALFGRWLGAGVLSLAGILSATVSFLAARYFLRQWVQRRFPRIVWIVNKGIERDGLLYVAMLRVVPVLPFFVINMSLALTSLSARKYVVISWLCMLPFAFLYANAGTAIRQMESPRDVFSPEVMIALVMLALLPLLLRMVLKRFTSRRERMP